MSIVKDYFNEVAFKYNEASQSGIWRLFRNSEKAAIKSLLPPFKTGMNALDLGCGSGFYTSLLRDLGFLNITCVDFSKEMLDQIQIPGVIKVEADINKYSTPEKFDLILCAGTLEFIDDPSIVFNHMAKLLKSNGTFIVLMPVKNSLGFFYNLFHKANGITVRFIDNQMLLKLASDAGFSIREQLNVFPFSKVISFKV